ncbi:MAG TPA: metal-sulfur cluster assembly factor [Thermoplasmata archaeon]|nr:metal-sulfur cluster assembly factor [Thermoplasmata archaeon]
MPTESEVIEALKTIIDPHSEISVYDMRLIHDLKVTKDTVSCTFRPTSPFCPLGIHLAMNIKRRLKDLKGVKRVDLMVRCHVHEDTINKSLQEI